MNITQEKIDDLNALVKINITPEDYQAKVEKSIKDQAKKAKLPGFRPGMVPPAHIKKMYGKSILVDEINNMLSDSLNNYITQNEIQILGQPLPQIDEQKEYEWNFNENFEFNYELGLAPEFDVDFSSKDKLTAYQIKADEETLTSRIKNIRRSYGKMSNPDVVADGDVVYADLKQLDADGAIFEDGISATGSIRLDLINDQAIKDSLIGLKKGDEIASFDIVKELYKDAVQLAKILNISEDDATILSSSFHLSVKNINRLEEADLTQEFYDKLFGADVVKTEEEFKAKITEEVEGMLQQDAERKLADDLYKLGTEKVKMNLPDEFLKKWLKATNEKLDQEELEKGYDDFAKNLKWTLVENKIVKEQDIKIEYKDVFETAKKRLDAQFRMYSPSALPEEQLAEYTVQFLQNKENANRIFDEVRGLKVFEYLKSIITLENKVIDNKEFDKMA